MDEVVTFPPASSATSSTWTLNLAPHLSVSVFLVMLRTDWLMATDIEDYEVFKIAPAIIELKQQPPIYFLIECQDKEYLLIYIKNIFVLILSLCKLFVLKDQNANRIVKSPISIKSPFSLLWELSWMLVFDSYQEKHTLFYISIILPFLLKCIYKISSLQSTWNMSLKFFCQNNFLRLIKLNFKKSFLNDMIII